MLIYLQVKCHLKGRKWKQVMEPCVPSWLPLGKIWESLGGVYLVDKGWEEEKQLG